MATYTAITFSPVQGFIEKSRKLRDLYGASLILSYLSQELIEKLTKNNNDLVISPALLSVTQGTPNRILLKGDFSHQIIEKELKRIWKKLLDQCEQWFENEKNEELNHFHYTWHREWKHWKAHTWELFSGRGESIKDAMNDLENNKLSRDWTAINWIGESSSITGTDAIAWYGLGRGSRNPNNTNWGDEGDKIAVFYQALSSKLNEYIDENERLSIPELVKRLITIPEIADPINFELPKELRDQNFTDFIRRPQDHPQNIGQWTGWFIADGDKVGDHLQSLAGDEQKIKNFTQEMRKWGKNFTTEFNQKDIGRVVYAGGDDFFGVIYNRDFGKKNHPKNQDLIDTLEIHEWLKQLPQEWKEDKSEETQKITLSMGFIWAGHSIPQRDILQHCREAEQISKEKGRNSITIRILFNNGQYVQWTTPWQYLELLDYYGDRSGGKNWNHIYNDLAVLKSRHAFGLGYGNSENQKQLFNGSDILNNRDAILEFFEIYFRKYKKEKGISIKDYLEAYHRPESEADQKKRKTIFKYSKNWDDDDYAWDLIHWIENLITVSFYLFKDIN
jgi:CRISPR-associated protein Cmr2